VSISTFRFAGTLFFALAIAGTVAHAGSIAYSGSGTTYTITVTGTYDITAAGAQGGFGFEDSPGLGALIDGDVFLTAGTVLQVDVGGQGAAGGSATAAAEGRNFHLRRGRHEPIIVAGGGGGRPMDSSTAYPV